MGGPSGRRIGGGERGVSGYHGGMEGRLRRTECGGGGGGLGGSGRNVVGRRYG